MWLSRLLFYKFPHFFQKAIDKPPKSGCLIRTTFPTLSTRRRKSPKSPIGKGKRPRPWRRSPKRSCWSSSSCILQQTWLPVDGFMAFLRSFSLPVHRTGCLTCAASPLPGTAPPSTLPPGNGKRPPCLPFPGARFQA